MFQQRRTRFAIGLAAIALLSSTLGAGAQGNNPVVTKSPVFTFQEHDDTGKVVFIEDSRQVEGAWSMVIRRGHGAVHWVFNATELTPGHAYTVWLVIFNNPAACSGEVMCGPDDVLMDTSDPANSPLNMDQVEAAGISMLFAGDSGVAGQNGRAVFKGVILEGSPPSEPVFGPGLTDADGAEIHLVLQDHGPASSDPDVLWSQLNEYQGGCDTPCADPYASPHLP